MKTPSFSSTSAIYLLATLQLTCSLKCYKCNDCESTSATKEVCREPDPSHETAACLIQRVRIAHNPDPMTIKKCVRFETGKNYQCIELPDSDPYSCNICQQDFCNSAPGVTMTRCSTLFAVLLLLMPKFFYY